MKTHLVQIGNSRGVRIPKPLLEEAGLKEEVEVTVENGQLLIKPIARLRQGWKEAFQKMTEQAEDVLADHFPENEWDNLEWQWE